jgi:tumor protein p63
MCDNSPNSSHSLEQINTDELFNTAALEGHFEIDSETLANNLPLFDSNLFNSQSDSQPMLQYLPPPHLQNLPEIEDMPDNDWNFDMILKSETNNKSSWLYSSALNKVFVKMNTPMNVYPTFNSKGNTMGDFFIRAMIVYTSSHDLPDPVNKCPNHKQGQGDFADHILRCTNTGVGYTGHALGKIFSEKLAVIVNMGRIAMNEPLTLQFTCQNSCSGGMNRRSTSLVFTLEDNAQNILGRKVMHFKVCSCPRRDKEKDESTTKVFPKKRKPEAGNLPSTSAKRIHLSKQDSDSALDVSIDSTLQSIKIEPDTPCEVKVVFPNEKFKKNTLRFLYDSIAGEITRTGNTTYSSYLNDLQKQIGK